MATVKTGMDWAYRRYLTDRSLIVLEQQARPARRGLWSDPAPVPPWKWRRTRKAEGAARIQ
jgi:micrococcal nuclease